MPRFIINSIDKYAKLYVYQHRQMRQMQRYRIESITVNAQRRAGSCRAEKLMVAGGICWDMNVAQ